MNSWIVHSAPSRMGEIHCITWFLWFICMLTHHMYKIIDKENIYSFRMFAIISLYNMLYPMIWNTLVKWFQWGSTTCFIEEWAIWVVVAVNFGSWSWTKVHCDNHCYKYQTVNPIALRKAKIVYNFGLSESKRVNTRWDLHFGSWPTVQYYYWSHLIFINLPCAAIHIMLK